MLEGTELDLSECEVTNEDLPTVAALTNLTWLDLSETQVSDVAPLAALKANIYR